MTHRSRKHVDLQEPGTRCHSLLNSYIIVKLTTTNYASSTWPHIVYFTGYISRAQVDAKALYHLKDFPSVTSNDVRVSLIVPVGRRVITLEGKVNRIRPGVSVIWVS